MMTESIALVGFMASGKSAVAPPLAMRLGLDFIDLDAEVARCADQSIPEIFASRGEEGFRELEAAELVKALQGQPSVVATGGGVVELEENRSALIERATCVWLDLRFETVRSRIDESDVADRPLVHRLGWDGMRELHRRRRPLYAACAHLRYDADRESNVRLARRIALALQSTAGIS